MASLPSPTTYQQRAYRSDDHAAILDKAHHARLQIADFETKLAAGEAQIRAAQSRYDALPASDRGWMLELIGVLAVVSIVLEWFPARMMSLVFFFASKVELVALTAAFAVGGFLLGLLVGELLRRHRKPQPHAFVDWLILGCAWAAVIAFLAAGFMLRLAYANASNDASAAPMTPIVQAAALTTLAFIGIVIAFTSGFYRESVEAMHVRRRLARLRGALRSNEAHLESTRQELAASERAFRVSDDVEGVAAEERAAATAAPTAAASSEPLPTAYAAGNGVVH